MSQGFIDTSIWATPRPGGRRLHPRKCRSFQWHKTVNIFGVLFLFSLFSFRRTRDLTSEGVRKSEEEPESKCDRSQTQARVAKTMSRQNHTDGQTDTHTPSQFDRRPARSSGVLNDGAPDVFNNQKKKKKKRKSSEDLRTRSANSSCVCFDLSENRSLG